MRSQDNKYIKWEKRIGGSKPLKAKCIAESKKINPTFIKDLIDIL
jgi:hypothetical protein